MSKWVVLPDDHPHLTSPIEGEGQIIPPPLVGGVRGGGMLTELKCYILSKTVMKLTSEISKA